MFLPRHNILSWRSSECEIENEDIGASELNQSDETKEQCASVNFPDSRSVQDLTSLFSRLSLHETEGNRDTDAKDERNPIDVGFKEQHAKQEHIYSSWSLSNTQGQFMSNQDFTCYFALHFQPLFYAYLQCCCGSENCYLPSTQTVTKPRESSSHCTNSTFLNLFSHFYIHRSSFWSFLVNLLARAGRLKARFDDYARNDVCTDDVGLSESSAEVRRKDSEGSLLVRRVPSQKQETRLEELVACTSDEHSPVVVDGNDRLAGECEFNFSEESLTEGCGADITKQGAFDEVREMMFSKHGNKKLKQDFLALKDGQYSDAEVTLTESLEEARLRLIEDFAEERTLVGEQEYLTSERIIFLENEITPVAEQQHFNSQQKIHPDEEVISFESVEEYNLAEEHVDHWRELTFVEEQDSFMEELASTNNQEYTAVNCCRAIDKLLAEINAHMRGMIVEENTCDDGLETRGKDQGTCLAGQEINLERQAIYAECKKGYLEDQGSNFEGRIYLEGKEMYFEGLGKETFRTVRNASPRARELLEKSRNLSRPL